MQLYYCRVKDDPKTYLGRMRATGVGYIPTTSLDEVRFCSSRRDAEATAEMFPELEVCCISGEPMRIPMGEGNMLNIPGADAVTVESAVRNFWSALAELQAIAPILFTNEDDNGVLLEYSGIEYDKEDKRIYVDLKYLAGEPVGFVMPGVNDTHSSGSSGLKQMNL